MQWQNSMIESYVCWCAAVFWGVYSCLFRGLLLQLKKDFPTIITLTAFGDLSAGVCCLLVEPGRFG